MRDNSIMKSPIETTKVKHHWGRSWPILAAFLLFVGLGSAVWLLPELLVGWSLRPSSPGGKNGIDVLNGVERTDAVTTARLGVLFAAGGLIAIISLVITWLRHRIDREKQDLDREKQDLDRDSDLRGRYAQASEQLGHGRPAVRLAGVYAMAALADDWQSIGNIKQQKVCVDVLCAYLRMPYDPGSEIAKSGEKEVRLTIIKTITERLQNPSAPNTWCGLPLDFTGVVFDGGNFEHARFSDGHVSFKGAVFTGGHVSFDHAVFTATVFSNKKVSFDDAVFSGGHVSFDGAVFTGEELSFEYVTFIGAVFSGGHVTFIHAVFSGGHVSLKGARFTSGEVHFNDAEVTGGSVSFLITKFTGGDISFNRVKFTGGNVIFSGAEFAKGHVSFEDAEFTGGNVTFKLASFTGGNADFTGVSGSHKGDLSFTGPRVWTHPPHVPWGDGGTPAWVSPNVWPPALAP